MLRKFVFAATVAGLFTLNPVISSAQSLDAETVRAWVEEMKDAPRGPFRRLRWFCNDGEVLPPKPYACQDHDGGVQHGEWTDRTKQIRDAGYKIANVLAALDPEDYRVAPAYSDIFKSVLVERFLIKIDSGWILRKARNYRGAIQEEDERRVTREMLLAYLQDQDWLTEGYLPMRVGAATLPHGADTRSVLEVRQLSTTLAEADENFAKIRNKIHGRPDASDAALVRQYVRKYVRKVSDVDLALQYEQLAEAIDDVYRSSPMHAKVRSLARRVKKNERFAELLNEGAQALKIEKEPGRRMAETSRLLIVLRFYLPEIKRLATRLQALDLSLALEVEHFVASTALRTRMPRATRQQRLNWLQHSAGAVYGTGLISVRELRALREAFGKMQGTTISLRDYKSGLSYMERVPGWGSQWLRYHFGDTMHKFAEIEPLSELFIQDQLRGSPLLFYSEVLDSLIRDANALAGVQHTLFDKDIGGGLRSLNPGLARGVLRLNPGKDTQAFESDGIYLLPETVADLPPVAGILTAGEGNQLSHVQLLARNLGIPNIGIDERLLDQIRAYAGKRVVLAASPAGVVQLSEDREGSGIVDPSQQDVLIRPDLQKLNLNALEMVPLSTLRATDSGVTVGPKAAKLGELYHHYPEAVADGVAIPFGIFRKMLEQPHASGQTIFQWMVGQYSRLRALAEGSEVRKLETERFRAALQDTILNADPGDEFRQQLRKVMRKVFGRDGSYGVFVRSDTNVEDLPGFTGAGLNLTVPNAVGFDSIVEGISRVWASPFSQRAFAWRQAHMDQPQHVYPAVLLLLSVPAEKSGVLVTQDVDTGDRNWLSVAVNEGVGGAVDGQAAESIRINMQTREVRLLAPATAPIRREVKKGGGVSKVPVSALGQPVLQPTEIQQLVQLAGELPQRFPAITDAQGKVAPADIEFGFLEGKLKLFQIRPFLESKRARGSELLNKLDRSLYARLNTTVALDRVPAPAKL